MKTSYFAKIRNLYGANLVSIALKTPPGFKGTVYTKLAPTYDLLIKWKNGNMTEEEYIKEYKLILNKLDPHKVYRQLGEDAILLCYEKSGDFCHRHIVAKWFNNAGYNVEEL